MRLFWLYANAAPSTSVAQILTKCTELHANIYQSYYHTPCSFPQKSREFNMNDVESLGLKVNIEISCLEQVFF